MKTVIEIETTRSTAYPMAFGVRSFSELDRQISR
jgi:hypothetical protein